MKIGGVLLLSNAVGIVVTILVINVIYVTFSTIRMILTLKGRRYLAALVSTIEIVVYILGLSIVLDNLSEIQNIIAYAVGYALGIIIGSIIEERLALGYITVNVVSVNTDLPFTKKLREAGFGVTSWRSSGMDGDRLSMQILAPRKRELQLYQVVTEIDPKAFIVSYEPKHIQGGFWVKQVRKLTQNKEQAERVMQMEMAKYEASQRAEIEENEIKNALEAKEVTNLETNEEGKEENTEK